LCLANYASVAQTLSGRISDKESGIGLYPVAITNLNTRISVLSNEDGTYSIEARSGEQVAFTLIGYKAQQKTVPYTIHEPKLDIVLVPVSHLLDEVLIKGMTKYQKDSLYRAQVFQRPLAARRATFMSPFSVLAEQFSRTSKQKFRFQSNFYKWETQQFIDSRYTPQLVEQLTGLKGDTLAHFISSYEMPYDYARAASDLELKMWIRTRYKEYMQEEKFRNIPVIRDSLIKP
jgi:hypothetical protein